MALQNPHTIDLIAQDPATNDVVLGMTEIRPWDGSDRRVYELQEKVNAYLSFALDGEMAENFPQFAQMNVVLRLDCVEEPDDKMNYFIGFIREQIAFQGISFLVNVVPELAKTLEEGAQQGCCGGGSGGGGCGCAEPVAHDHVLSMGGCCGGGSCGDDGHSHQPHSHAESGCCGGGENQGNHGGCGCHG